jgi:HEAT repeat protein
LGENEADAIKALKSDDVETRRRGATCLQFLYRYPLPDGASPAKEVIAALLKALCDPDEEVRLKSIHTFANFGEASRPAVPLMADLLVNKGQAGKVRQAAARTLLELGPVSKESLSALKKAMNDSDKVVQIYAATAVAGLERDNQQVLQFLLAFSTDKDKEVRWASSSAFGNVGVRVIPLLKDGLKDNGPVVRDWTVRAFLAIIKKLPEQEQFPADAIPLLINAIHDEDTEVALRAIDAVSQLGSQAKEAIPTIAKRFKDPEWQVREYAIRHVPEFGPAAESAIPALTEAMKDQQEHVRVAAKRAIEAIEEAKKAKMPQRP